MFFLNFNWLFDLHILDLNSKHKKHNTQFEIDLYESDSVSDSSCLSQKNFSWGKKNGKESIIEIYSLLHIVFVRE